MPKPICFMVMPYGQRQTGVSQGQGPDTVNFDTLWENAFFPALDTLGYEPVRADQDLGALIIKEMLERLALADLVVADVTIPNANVYYEIGVRHAAKETGCVMLAADWSQQLFDISQMPHLRYPLAEGHPSDNSVKVIQNLLEEKLTIFSGGQSPVFQSLPGYPNDIDVNRATAFRDFANQLAKFQGKIKAIRAAPKNKRKERVLALLNDYTTPQPVIPAIAIEFLYALRDFAGWQALSDYIDFLPEEVRNLPIVQEQHHLALSKTGSHNEAIEALEAMVEQFGDTSERQGLLGGRYKKLYQESNDDGDQLEYLDQAIEHYEKGMILDLNDYYPSCNLPRLYRIRNEEGDEDLARNAAVIAMKACERARTRDPNDPWIRPTLLGAAFDTGNVSDAQLLLKEVRKGRPADWLLKTTIGDLKASNNLHKDPEVGKKFELIIDKLERLIDVGGQK
jgi:tetratricopeptide (TPR) repeat protein